jgi:hypothetical protein
METENVIGASGISDRGSPYALDAVLMLHRCYLGVGALHAITHGIIKRK